MQPNSDATKTARRGSDVHLVGASVITGVAGAGFILIVQRHLGLTDFSPIAQLWSIWSIAAATLMFAYQQWTIRLGIDHPRRIVQSLRGGPLLVVGLCVLGTSIGVGAARTTLFHSADWFWPAAAALIVLGTIIGGITRGVLATAGRHSMLALAIAAENVIRFALAVVLIVTDAPRAWFGVALLAGFAVAALLALPSTGHAPFPAAEPNPPNSTGASTLGSAAVAGFLSHIALAAPPILAAFNGADADTVSTMFIVLTAVRLPHLLLQAGAPRAGVVYQAWFGAAEHARLDRARTGIALISISLATAGAGVGALVGDRVVGSLFDIRNQVDGQSYALMTSAAVLSVGATFATVLLVAEGRNRLLIARWAVPLAVVTVSGVAARVTTVDLVAAGLVALHLTVLLGLTVLAGSPHQGAPRASSPASTR